MSAPIGPNDCPYVGLDPFDAAHAQYFFGRRQDSRVLADHVQARKLTVFYGASGTGKTSVLNVGLRGELKSSGMTIAILRDWQDPVSLDRRATAAVFNALSEQQRAKLPQRLRDPETRPRFIRFVVGVIRFTRLPLVLILDQFEEYFLYRNLYPNRDEMRRVEAAIGKLVARGDFPFHLVLSMRDDGLHRLDELRAFIPGLLDTTVRLGHLSETGVADAIKGPIKEYNKKYRADREPIVVKERLVSALIEQLKRAEHGLVKSDAGSGVARPIELSYLQLTLMKLWDAEGGPSAWALSVETLTTTLGGVRRIVRDHIGKVMGGLTAEEQQLCARVFDRLVTGIGSKIAYPTKGLAADEVAGPGIDEATVERVLLKLTPKDSRILKTVNTNGLPGFELFHDVLGLPILEWMRAYRAEARAKRELAAAEEIRVKALAESEQRREEEFARAEVMRQKERLRRTWIVLSVMGVLGAIAASGVWISFTQQQELARQSQQIEAVLRRNNLEQEFTERARGLGFWRKFSLGTATLTRQEVDALWQLTIATGAFRDGFLTPLDADVADTAAIATLGKRPEPILRSLGLTWTTSEPAKNAVNGILRAEITVPEALNARAQALAALRTSLTAEESQLALDPILSAMKHAVQPVDTEPRPRPRSLAAQTVAEPQSDQTQSNRDAQKGNTRLPDITTLTIALSKLPTTSANDEIPKMLDLILRSTGNTNDPGSQRALGRAAGVVADRHSPEQARLRLQKIAPDAARAVSAIELPALTAALRSLGSKLPDDETQAVLLPILREMSHPAKPGVLAILAALPGELPVALTPEQLSSVMQLMLQTYTIPDSDVFAILLNVMERLTRNLDPKQAQIVLDAILTTLERETNINFMRSLARLLALVPVALSAEEGERSLRTILPALLSSTSSSLDILFDALTSIADKLDASQAQSAFAAILPLARRSADYSSQYQLQEAVRALAQKLDSSREPTAFKQVWQELQQSTDVPARDFLTDILESLQKTITEKEAQDALAQILPALDQNPDANSLATQAKILAGQIPQEQARNLLDTFLLALEKSKSPQSRSELSRALTALSSKLSAAEARAALHQLFARIEQSIIPATTAALASVSIVLARKAGPEQAQDAVEPIIRTLSKLAPTETTTLRALSLTLKELKVNLTNEQAARATKPMREALDRWKTSPVSTRNQATAFRVLAEALAAIPATIGTEYLEIATDTIRAAVDDPPGLTTTIMAQAAHTLAPRLSGTQAQSLLSSILKAIGRTDNFSTAHATTRAAKSLLTNLTEEQRKIALNEARTQLADARAENVADGLAEIIAAIAAKQSNEEYLAIIVDVLKYPTAAGDATATLIEDLRKKFANATPPEDNFTAVVSWLRDKVGPDMVASPPANPNLPNRATLQR